MAAIEIYGTANCTFVYRTRLIMTEKGIDFEFIIVDTKNKADWFLEISPYGKVPVIKHGDHVLYESAIINEYLDEVFTDKPLMPADPVLRARDRIWVDYCNTRIIPAGYAVAKSTPGPERDKAREAAIKNLRFLETDGFGKLSGEGPYLLGGEPTLADFALYPFFERMAAHKAYRDYTVPDDCTRINKWFAAMSARPSVKAHVTSPEEWVEKMAERMADTPTANAAE